jgi:hypothetical protein
VTLSLDRELSLLSFKKPIFLECGLSCCDEKRVDVVAVPLADDVDFDVVAVIVFAAAVSVAPSSDEYCGLSWCCLPMDYSG